MLNLDTHILLYALADKVTKEEYRLLANEPWSLSPIVLWEITKLVQLGRIELDIDAPEFSLVLSNIHVWPLSLDVCRAIRKLDFKSDPADEIIAATSLVHNVPLVTRDRRMKESRVVPLA